MCLLSLSLTSQLGPLSLSHTPAHLCIAVLLYRPVHVSLIWPDECNSQLLLSCLMQLGLCACLLCARVTGLCSQKEKIVQITGSEQRFVLYLSLSIPCVNRLVDMHHNNTHTHLYQTALSSGLSFMFHLSIL